MNGHNYQKVQVTIRLPFLIFVTPSRGSDHLIYKTPSPHLWTSTISQLPNIVFSQRQLKSVTLYRKYKDQSLSRSLYHHHYIQQHHNCSSSLYCKIIIISSSLYYNHHIKQHHSSSHYCKIIVLSSSLYHYQYHHHHIQQHHSSNLYCKIIILSTTTYNNFTKHYNTPSLYWRSFPGLLPSSHKSTTPRPLSLTTTFYNCKAQHLSLP